jgi:hypothetical protein
MKALCVKQPWANLISMGLKTIETRTWKTNYRGPLIICSSKTPDIYPAGFALCEINLIDCRPMIPEDYEAAGGVKWEEGRYSWVLELTNYVDPMVPIQGKLGIFELEF